MTKVLKRPVGLVVGGVYLTKTKIPEKYIVEEILSSRLVLGGIRIKYLESGFTKYYDARSLRRGDIKSPYQKSVFGVGYFGEGIYFASGADGKPTAEYRRWKAILSRCYNKIKHSKDDSYKGCQVSDSWLNFQNFASWLTSQPQHAKGFEIDKDLLVVGNTVYGPDTCCLLPRVLNCAITGKDQATLNGLPCGVVWHKKNCCYVAAVGRYGKKDGYIGSFKSVEAAWAAYKSAKEAYVRELADEYSGSLSPFAYFALVNYKAEQFYNCNFKEQSE